MRRGGIIQAVRWPVAAALAFAGLLTVLLLFADQTTDHRYADLPDPPMRVGLPPGYDYCGPSPPSLRYYYPICDRRREAEFSGFRAARYSVWLLDADASSRLGFDASEGIETARGAISAAYFTRLDLAGTGRRIDPSLDVRSVEVDGHEALEFTTTGTASLGGAHLLVIDLDDGRLVAVVNKQFSVISPEADASNFQEIVAGIQFHQ